jgi:hypothetical protein
MLAQPHLTLTRNGAFAEQASESGGMPGHAATVALIVLQDVPYVTRMNSKNQRERSVRPASDDVNIVAPSVEQHAIRYQPDSAKRTLGTNVRPAGKPPYVAWRTIRPPNAL